MSESIKTLHDQKVESASKELSNIGYSVMIEPESTGLPFDLGNYRPDLIAFKDNGGIILEVNANRSRLSVDRFQEIAETIATHDGWRFVLVTPDDVAEKLLPEGKDDLPSWGDLQAKIENIENLIQQAMVEPALLYLWSAIEALLRKRAISQNIPIERFPAIKLLNHMYSSGEISMQEFDLVKSIFEKRNRVAHGLVTSLTSNELIDPLAMTRSLIEKWREAK